MTVGAHRGARGVWRPDPGGIHIFIGETVDFDGNALVSSARTAFEPETFAEIRSEQDPPMAGTTLDLDRNLLRMDPPWLRAGTS